MLDNFYCTFWLLGSNMSVDNFWIFINMSKHHAKHTQKITTFPPSDQRWSNPQRIIGLRDKIHEYFQKNKSSENTSKI